MKNLLKNLGPIMILVGVIILAIYFFTESNSNTYLASAGIIMVVGFFTHIFTNKKIK
ncbi:MAG: hypothetical protein LLF95_07290 [Bacteroidales bacterium]|nr:hypothetical protein [Bacteroidales bacterium]